MMMKSNKEPNRFMKSKAKKKGNKKKLTWSNVLVFVILVRTACVLFTFLMQFYSLLPFSLRSFYCINKSLIAMSMRTTNFVRFTPQTDEERIEMRGFGMVHIHSMPKSNTMVDY